MYRLPPTHRITLEDFWLRRDRHSDPAETFRLFGLPLTLKANAPAVFDALRLSLRMYSAAPTVDNGPTLSIHVVVREASWQPGPPPRDLYPQNLFAGDGDWLMIQFGAWGHAHVDLAAHNATVVLTPELAAEPDVVARGVFNTILNNLLTSAGFGMLHCTGLLRDGRVLLLMAPHNSGKSTTALRLALSDYQLLSDSQIYVSPFHDAVTILGFPVGRARLRRDMLPHFPQLHDFLRPEAVRGETKFSFDLRDFDQALVQEHALRVEKCDLCLLSRSGGDRTTIVPTTAETVWDAVIHNSIFYDSDTAWARNLAAIRPLIERAELFDLQIGWDAAELVSKIQEI